MPAVVFDVMAWRARYPEFFQVPNSLAQAYFDEAAAVYLDNTDVSPVQDLVRRAVLLNMLVAHLAALSATQNGTVANPLVGRLSSVSEGSVSASADVGPVTGSMAWFAQTKYGYSYWQATASLRLGRYVAGPARLPRRPAIPFRFNYGG